MKNLVADLLGIPVESIGQFVIRNPEMPPENLGDKFCRLDINMTVNGQRVDLEVPVMSQAINAYYTITASSEFREKERLREKARHDEAQALHHAKREEKLEMAQKLMDMDLPFEQIMKVTGLTRADLESLRTKI